MLRTLPARLGRLAAVLALGVPLAACNAAERIASIGAAPELTPIENPATDPDYTPVRMPMPAPHGTTFLVPSARSVIS